MSIKSKKLLMELEREPLANRVEADLLLFEAYPYLSLNGLKAEYEQIVKEKNESTRPWTFIRIDSVRFNRERNKNVRNTDVRKKSRENLSRE
jgi:hypothetical protein